jgi:protein-disulfide isomerase
MPSKRPAGTLGLVLALVPALAGLVASVMLAVDYLRPAPVFCAESGGCGALRHSAYAGLFGIPTPLFGVTGFLLLAVVTLMNGGLARVLQLALGATAGLTGLFLLVVQVRLGTFCPFCLVADTSGILAALAASGRLWVARDEPAPHWAVGAGAGLVVAAAGVPLAVGLSAKPPPVEAPTVVPQVIRDEIAATPKGQVTLVDFVDFECPYCRMTNEALEPLLEARKGQVRVVRRMVPIRTIHPHAMDAARAWCCAERQGKEEEMAHALFSAPVEELTTEGCERIASRLGLSIEAYRACIVDPATDAAIEADRKVFHAAEGEALPTIWVNEQVLVGAQTSEQLAAALDRATGRGVDGGGKASGG